MHLTSYIPLCNALVRLMDPLVEVVIHDIEKNTIAYIAGRLSKRAVGDASLLEVNDLENLDHVIYPKINFDGRLIKSVSVLLVKTHLLCINCDVSLFHQMERFAASFVQVAKQPTPLFTNDWQERLHASIHDYVRAHHLSFDHLTQSHKKALTKHLYDAGAFHEKKAADYVAKVLGMGRATVFNYLKEWRAS